MIDITLDMEQYDCPFIDTTVENDVAFAAVHWEFDEARHQLSTRMLVEGDDRGALENGLHTLDAHDNMYELDLLSKQGEVAHVRTSIEETAAMGTIRANDGYITGPFHIESGSELWHVGFDRGTVADDTLCSLDEHNDFSVVERSDVSLSDLSGFVQNVGAAMALVEGCRELSDTERVTLETAVQEGYFDTPRDATLGDLAERFGVSKPAVSKRLRRGQGKLAGTAVDALDDID